MTSVEQPSDADRSQESTAYTLLSKAEAAAFKDKLAAAHYYFFHFTLDTRLSSIKASGLDPSFEGADSQYNRTREPAKAMRYCIRSFLDVGLSTANTRNQYWDERQLLWLPKPSKVIVIRTSAASLLRRSFGLDHSFSNADLEVSRILGGVRQQLTADEFIGVATRFGAISCYEAVPAGELEVCLDPEGFCRSLSGVFSPLD